VINTAYIGLGSNIGDRKKNILSALEIISSLKGNKIESVSSLYESSPYGNEDQDNFLNAVIKLSTSFDHQNLLKILKEIEVKIGRIFRERWGPREIDLDILFYNNLIFSNEIITLPHEGVIYRDFVLVPLCEIEPELIHPVYDKKVCEFLSELKVKSILQKFIN